MISKTLMVMVNNVDIPWYTVFEIDLSFETLGYLLEPGNMYDRRYFLFKIPWCVHISLGNRVTIKMRWVNPFQVQERCSWEHTTQILKRVKPTSTVAKLEEALLELIKCITKL